MPFDAFISYSSKDKTVADAVCARLEAAGIRCWIAPRDVLAGTSYGEAIIEAIHTAKIMVLVFSSNANTSGHIPKEVERAVSNGLTILPFRIEDVPPGKSLDYFIGSVHWLDAMTPPMEKHLDALAATVQRLLPVKPEPLPVPPPIPPKPVPTPVRGPSKALWIGISAVAVLVLIVLGFVLYPKPPAPVTTVSDAPRGVNAAPAPSSGPVPKEQQNVGDLVKRSLEGMEKIAANETLPGCYQWFNNQPVVIHRDGRIVGGPFTGRWQLMTASADKRTYTFTWPEATDTVTVAPDQQSLSGQNQYGFPTSGTRMSPGTGVVGVWRWPNGVPVTVAPNGTFTAATFHGQWRAVDPARGIYTLTWPKPVDSVALSADSTHISGSNQYGIAISGVRTHPCAVQ